MKRWDGALALPEALADGARHASLLLGDADKDDTLPRFELPQPLVHDIVFAHPFLKADDRGCLSLGKVEHLMAKSLAHRHCLLGRSEPVALVAAEIGRHPRCARQLRHIEVQIHSVDAFQLEDDIFILEVPRRFLAESRRCLVEHLLPSITGEHQPLDGSIRHSSRMPLCCSNRHHPFPPKAEGAA
jgi:hypothetical protein